MRNQAMPPAGPGRYDPAGTPLTITRYTLMAGKNSSGERYVDRRTESTSLLRDQKIMTAAKTAHGIPLHWRIALHNLSIQSGRRLPGNARIRTGTATGQMYES